MPAATSPSPKHWALTISNWLSWLVLAGGLMTVLASAYLVFVSYSPVPYMDQWWFLHVLQDENGGFPLARFWEQHNEHRIIVPRLFYLADYNLFGGRNVFLLLCIFLVQCGQAALIAYWVRGREPAVQRTAIGLAAFCCLLPTQRENLIWGFQIAFVLPFLCASLGLIGAARYAATKRTVWLGAVWGCALVGSFSLSSGFLLWPVFALALLLLSAPWRSSAGTVLLGALLLEIYFYNYRSPAHSDPLAAVQHPGELWAFLTRLLGVSWAAVSPPLAPLLAGITVVLFSVAAVYVLWRRTRIGTAERGLVLLGAYALLSTLLTAIGRLNAGLAGRYQTPAMLFWAVVGVLVVLSATGRRWWLIAAVSQALILIVMSVAARHFTDVRDEVRQRAASMEIGAMALAAQVGDREALASLGMLPELPLTIAPFLRQERKSFYRDWPAAELDQRLSEVTTRTAAMCQGDVSRLRPVQAENPRWFGGRLTGFAWDPRVQRPPVGVLVAVGGIVRGVGDLDSPAASVQGAPTAATWRAFVPASSPAGALAVYGVLPDHSLCQVPDHAQSTLQAADFQASPVDSATLAEFGAEITPVWIPGDALKVSGGEAAMHDGVLDVRVKTNDVQLTLPSRVALSSFATLLFQLRVERPDVIEMFFGRAIDGRTLTGGYPPMAQRWLYVLANVGGNPYWRDEAGRTLRLDPTGLAGLGSVVRLGPVWGLRASRPAHAPAFEFRLAQDSTLP